MSEQFRSNASIDASSVIIEDFAGGEMVRVYPYSLPNTKRGNEFIQSNSTSLVYYTQEDLGLEGLEKDDEGNVYFEVLSSQTTSTEAITNAGINKNAEELSEVKAFSVLSNYWPKKVRTNLTLGQFNLTPMIFTIGAPLDEDAWNQNLQPVFIASSFIAAKDSESDLAYEITEDGIVEATFVNVFTLTSQYKNCAIQFTKNNFSQINSASLTVPVNSLFGGAYGRSVIGNSIEDVSIAEPKRYPIWNASPNHVDNRLEMFMKWADHKLVLPIHIIERFKTEKPLSTLFKDDSNAWLANGEELFHLLKDMMLYTKLYVDQWKDIQQQDKLADATNSNYGQVKINVTVGSANAPVTYQAGKRIVNTIVNKSPAEVTATLYETYLNDNPGVDKGTLNIFKAAVVALSRYIRTGNLALGGGLNDFNSIYLPWRLKTANKINITREESGGTVVYYIKEDPEILFDSHWYEFDGADLKPKLIDNLYKTQLIQSERNISQPLIPMELSEVSISSNPGGVSIESDGELRYNWWIPTTDPNVLNKLMLKDLTTTVTDSVDQILNDRTARITDTKTLNIINEIKSALGTNVLAADYASETQVVKDIISKWYKDHIENVGGTGFWAGVAQFFAAFGPLKLIGDAEEAIIKATGYEKGELENFGVAGANWVEENNDPALAVWRFMKVIQNGFDSTGFDTVNHAEQYNGQLFSGKGMTSLTYPVENWMREIKGSWLNKYLANEAGLRAFLFDQAVSLLTAFNHPSWDTRAHQIPEAKFLEFFPALKGHMVFTQFELRLNGYIDVNYNGNREGWGEESVAPGVQLVPLKFERAQAIIKLEIIEQIPVIYPSSVHYKLKAGVTQSFNLGGDRELIFSKDLWQNLIRVIRPTNFFEDVPLAPIKGEDFGELRELDVFLLWASNITLTINGVTIVINSINDYDEKIVKQKIIFT